MFIFEFYKFLSAFKNFICFYICFWILYIFIRF